ncbi:LOW QUALITY PROTEIN: kelch domain-containing protein 7B [Lepus europaeus]|uniref:LOW QUALITY PROTEIN: kelch domain-containing protein 7B n=1 Tax=Lepus europaeus TaxID=9983 RepID=UPI002B46038E|nr:LOW QUALITY PROTEIN: kelch domain-containing protein 7B [Lepus europaeus]
MSQGALEAGGPLWGWDWDGDDDWEGAVLALLALAVVAATALALHWFGPGQDQQAARPESSAPGTQPAQAGGVRPTLHPKPKVSGGHEGQSPGQGKPGPLGHGQGGQAVAGAQGCKPSGGGDLHPKARLLPKTPHEALSRGTLGQQHGGATLEAPQGRGREPLELSTALLGGSQAGGAPAPVVIHFTPRSPGSEADVQPEVGSVSTKGPEHRDSSRWQLGAGLPGAPGRGRGSRRRHRDAGSGDRTRHRPKPDLLRLGTVASVWDAVDAASAAADSGAQGPAVQELSPGRARYTGSGSDSLEGRRGKSSAQPAPAPGPGVTGACPAGIAQANGSGEDRLSLGQGPAGAEKPGADHVFEAPAPASGPRPVSQEPRVALSKGYQERQVSTSWGSLIAMVLRSHPFPRQERPPGRAPRTAPGPPAHLSASTPSEDGQPASDSQGAMLSLGTATEAGAGGLAGSFETNGAPAPGSALGPREEVAEKKSLDSLPPAAVPRAPSQRVTPSQQGPAPSPAARRGSQPVPRPRKRSLCEIAQSSEREEVGQGQLAPRGQHRGGGGRAGDRPSGSGVLLTERQKEARKLMVFLQRPGSWGVVEGARKPRSWALEPAKAVALRRQLDLGSCLDVLAFAQRHGEAGLAQETYALMSNNLLHVLGDPDLYRQLSGADRERILGLRTGQGRAVLGVLVLPSLYQVSRSGSRGEEAPPSGPPLLPPPTHLHVFNPQENTWWPLTQVPEEAPLRGCGLCTMHNYLFLAGGIRGSGAKAVCSNEVFCYNPLTNIWSQVRPMQQARAQLKLVALDGLLYAIGGECLYSMECYDPRTDAWTSRAPLPAGTFPVAHEAVACRGDIYVTGGHLFYRLLRYSPVKDTWDECPYSATHRRSSDMVALGGFLYRFDLLRGVGAAVMRYNTVTGSWSRAASLPLPDPTPLRCAVLGNTIYCLNHQVTATFTVSEGTALFQAKELQPFPLGRKGVLSPFVLTLPSEGPRQTSL